MDPREWLFDKRVVRRNLDKGVLTMKAYKEYLKSTPDLNGEYEEIELGSDEGGEGNAAAAGDSGTEETAD